MGGVENRDSSLNGDMGDACSSLENTVCTRYKEYLTKEEEAVLTNIRALSEEASATKKKLKNLDSRLETGTLVGETGVELIDRERQALIDKLDALKKKRKELDGQREEAHHRKMVMLGHEDP